MTKPPKIDLNRHALFLDFDGTLVPLIDDPDAVHLPPGGLDRLTELQAELGQALAIVSGRRIADLDAFLSPLGFAAVGVHGLERRFTPSDPVSFLMKPERLDPVRDRLAPVLEGNPRLRLEDKGIALVLHYRTAPELETMAREAMARACEGDNALVVMDGDMIVEVHPAGMDKGKAVAELMTRPPFKGRIPVYLGDDTTDEFALKVVRDTGGVSIKVGAKESIAEYRLDDVDAVYHWLADATRI